MAQLEPQAVADAAAARRSGPHHKLLSFVVVAKQSGIQPWMCNIDRSSKASSWYHARMRGSFARNHACIGELLSARPPAAAAASSPCWHRR